MEKYCDTNLNYYIKIKLTEEGRIIYKKYYAKYNCEAPKLDIDDEGYVRFQIHEFTNIFGERLFIGATLPCETNCKIQVKDEWHNLEKDPNDLPNKELEEKQLLARVRNYEEDYIFAYYMIDKYNSLSGKRFYSDISCDYPINKKDIIAWKEIKE